MDLIEDNWLTKKYNSMSKEEQDKFRKDLGWDWWEQNYKEKMNELNEQLMTIY